MAKLTAAERDALPASAFVFPGSRQYPIQDLDHARNALARSAGKPENVAVKAAVYKKYPALKKADDGPTPEPIEKASAPLIADAHQQMVYGVVLSPDVLDSQEDIVDAAHIEKAAHRWLTEYRKHDVQHAEVTTNFDGRPVAEVVESFIAPQDMEIAGQRVLKGAWVLGAHINDDATWERITKGELTGFSIGGSGVREAIADTA